MATTNFWSKTPGITASDAGISSIDSTRRLYNFGDRVASLAPEQTPWFVYLSKVAKQSTDDPTFKFMEQRHQWQRRNFDVATTVSSAAAASGTVANFEIDVDCKYDKYGNAVDTPVAPEFLVVNQMVAIKCQYDSAGDGDNANDSPIVAHFRVASIATGTSAVAKPTLKFISAAQASGKEQVLADDSKLLLVATECPGEVIGSAFQEGTSFPQGWADELYAREGHCQIFKTASPVMSGTAQATRYRGIANEWQRVWKEKLMEHKMDIERGMLFGVGGAQNADYRTSWGIVPYTERYGKVYNYSMSGTAPAGHKEKYDGLLEIMEDFYAPESGNSGNKLCLASRSVISYFNKMNSGFVNSTIGAANQPFTVDVNYKDGKFGHKVAQVDTVFGGFTMVQEPLFRGPYADMMVLIDMANVKYRPLVGNGISRDTYIETNVQSPGDDARVDQILTEAGLQVELPETHAIIKFADN